LGLVVVGEGAFLKLGGVLEVAGDFILLRGVSTFTNMARRARRRKPSSYLFQRHAVLDQQGDPRIQVPDILLEDEVLLGLRRDLGLEVAEDFLSCTRPSASPARARPHRRAARDAPLASSSSISSSVSLADMDMYSADMEYRLDWRADREPS